MLALKRLSCLTTGRRADKVENLADFLLSAGIHTSQHPHVIASSLVFRYWAAAGEKRGGVVIRGRQINYVDMADAGTCRYVVESVLQAGEHDYEEYSEEGADLACETLVDAAVLWTASFDPARSCQCREIRHRPRKKYYT